KDADDQLDDGKNRLATADEAGDAGRLGFHFQFGLLTLKLLLNLAGDVMGGLGIAQTQPDAVDGFLVARAFLVIIFAEEKIARELARRQHTNNLEAQILVGMAGTKKGELLADFPTHLLHEIGAHDSAG